MSVKQDHKKWRKEFNYNCRERDNHKCVFCDETENLDVHHITNRRNMPNGGYVITNGITVCSFHHLLCENQTNEEYHPNKLYKKINSTYELAYNDSLNLK